MWMEFMFGMGHFWSVVCVSLMGDTLYIGYFVGIDDDKYNASQIFCLSRRSFPDGFSPLLICYYSHP